MDACDPNADIENLRQLIKLNTGVDIKLTKKEICQAYNEIQEGKLPLPPLVMNSSRTYLVDKKSPLKPNDYELLFDSSTKRAELKRIARKVDLKKTDQMTKSQIVDAIGKRLRYMKVHEPVKFARRTRVTVNKTTAVNENTAVNNVNTNIANNLNVNRTNNLNVNRTNNLNVNRVNNLNANRVNNLNANRVNNLNANRVNINSARANGTRPNDQRGVNFSRASVFRKGEKPAFLGGAKRAVREPIRNDRRPTNMNQRPNTMNVPKKPGFFGSVFGGKKKNFVPINKFKGEKKGYVFKQGNKGLGYYTNVGPARMQGPTLPNVTPQPIPATNLTAEEAVAKIKQLGLRREKKLIERLAIGTVSKKQVVAEAQQALEEEKRFLTFIDGLKLLNIESEYIKQRMAVDDLRQLRVEAQLKADERANIKRTNEEKMAMFLESTTLNKADKNAFLERARQDGANVNRLITEIKKLISKETARVLNKKKQEFRNLLKNYNKLSDKDKEDLVKSVDVKTNTNSMKKMAENLVKKRIDEKKNLVTQNLLSFLTPLKINQTNKNKFVKRFKNDSVNVDTLKREALNLEKSQMSKNVENLRVKLNTRLGEIGLNQVNQNIIMKKFRNGNRNVEKLIQEAKQLKAQRTAESGNKAKREYISYLNTLKNLTNDDKIQLIRSGNMNRNKALNLSKRRGVEKKDREKKEFVGFLAELGLTNENRTTMINKYNANTLNVEVLKKQAMGLRDSKISERKAKLLSHMNTLGLDNETKQKLLSRIENTNLNTLKANANGIASKIANEKSMREKRELEEYINSLNLGVNNKRSILNKNPSLDEGKRLANTKLREKQAKNREVQNRRNLENYINQLGLNTNNKLEILNKNPSLTDGKRLANSKLQMKIKEKRNKDRFALSVYLNKLGLTNKEKTKFLGNFNQNVNSNVIKANASAFVQNKKAQQKSVKRQELQTYLSKIGLTNQEQFQFLNKFNQNLDNANAIKKEANVYLRETAKQQRAMMREDLFMYLKGLNISETNAKGILKEFNNTNTNAQILKNRANAVVATRKRERFIQEEGEFMNYLNTLEDLTAENKTKITEKLNGYYTNWKSIKKSATNIALQRAKEKRDKQREELASYANNLGLNSSKKRSLLKALDNKAANLSTLKMEANAMKNQMNANAKAIKRKNLLQKLTKLDLTNQNRESFMEKFANNTSTVNAIFEEAKQLESQRIKTRRDELSLFMNQLGLEQNDKTLILKNFDVNPSGNAMLRNRATQLKNKRKQQEREEIRRELKEYLNTLNMLNSSNKKRLLANNSRSYNNVKDEANQLQVNKKAQLERKKEREDVSRYINTLNMLTKNNKQRLLANNSKNGNAIRNEANQLQEFKKTAKRGAELNTLKKAANGLNQNSQLYVIDKFETQNVTLNSMLKEVEQLKKKMVTEKRSQNRAELVDHMNSLNIGDNDKKKILKNYDSQKVNLVTLKNRATQINTAIKNKELQRQELSNYINGLGINGTQLIKKFNDGRSTLNRLKADADKMKTVANARLVNSKRDQLRAHMKNTRLNDKNKKSFINRVTVNTDMNSLKSEVNGLNAQLKTRNEELAAKRSEVSVFLNTLNDLRPENRKAFLAKVVSANTDTESIKREATSMNKAVKNRRSEKQRRDEEEKKKQELRAREVDKERLDRHLKGLKHLTKAEMAEYMSSFVRDGAKIEDVIATSKAKNKDNEKDKDTLKFYIRDAKIPAAKKDLYLRQLLQPHINTRPIKKMVNANKEAERIVGEALKVQVTKKLQALKAITANERTKFLDNLKTKPPKEVLNAAEKLDKKKRDARDKGIKNVAGQLSKLSNITRNNRVALMKRLPTNGPEKVLANAKALNKERKYDKLKPMLIAKAKKGGLGHFRKNIEAIKTNEDVKRVDEAMKKELEARQKAEKAKKSGEKDMKNVSSQLQGLTSLTRDNRKNLMKRLPTDGAKKVLANAKKIDQERKTEQKKIRDGVEFKLKKIGVKGSNLQALMKRWNSNKNQTIFDDARKKVEADKEKAMSKQPLLNKVLREIPGTFGVFRREWETAIKKADKPEELQRLDRLLDQKIKLKQDIEKAPIAEDKRRGQLRFVMKMSNNVEKRKQELTKDIKAKKSQGDRATAETAKKLQSMNKLERTNRQGFMDRIAKGENARTVLRNADKLQKERVSKLRLETERKKREQEQAKQRKIDEQKKREAEKAEKLKAGRAKGDVAGALRNMKALNRVNRKEFMARLNRGVDPGIVLRNARKRSAEKEMKQIKPIANPLFAPDNSKVPATNNPLFTLKDQKKKNREEAARRGVSAKKAQRNRQMREKEERAKIRKEAEAKSLREKVARNKAEAEKARARARAELEAKKKAQAQAVRDETERRRLAMLEKQKKKDAKAEFRKANRKLARATGQGVKATQKKQQQYRRRKK